jgi:hypothetical protein
MLASLNEFFWNIFPDENICAYIFASKFLECCKIYIWNMSYDP